MSEDKLYKDGDIVWVKLGNSWWPGEVIGDSKRLPDDVQQFKKQPYCVVKFFQEDAYEYPKTAKLVYPFQCSKKNEFIKKGLALFNAKKAFMEKFPDDVKHAENLTKSTKHGHGPVRRSIEFIEKGHGQAAAAAGGAGGGGGVGSNNNAGSQSNLLQRRDSVTTILNISSTPTSATPARTLSSSSSASVTPNTPASNQYRCNMCDFTTTRQNVLIMHRKSHSNSGGGGVGGMGVGSSGSTLIKQQSSNSTPLSTITSSIRQERLNISIEKLNESPKSANKTPPPPRTQAAIAAKKAEVIAEKIKKIHDIEEREKRETIESKSSSVKGRKKSSTSPSPRAALNSTKRSLRTLRPEEGDFVSPRNHHQSASTITSHHHEATKEAMKKTFGNEIEEVIIDNIIAGTESPEQGGHSSEQLRQRLLADWSDEEKEENHDGGVNQKSSGSKRNRALQQQQTSSLQLPSTNSKTSIKRRSPTIVSMKTLEGAGQTLVVAGATIPTTQSNIVQETTTPKTAAATATQQRIRNIPKKDRLRDFGHRGAAAAAATSADLSGASIEEKAAAVPPAVLEPSTEKPTKEVGGEAENETAAQAEGIATAAATLSCFDFQEDEEDNENDVLKSIANYKKKYFSPDKADKEKVSAVNENIQAKKRDHELLSAEIDCLLEQTTPVTQVSVKGLPIKERGKRIFKSRNRPAIDDENDVAVATTIDSTAAPSTKPTDIIEETDLNKAGGGGAAAAAASTTTTTGERKTRSGGGAGNRTRGKQDQDAAAVTSPINGNAASKNKMPPSSTPDALAADTGIIQPSAEMVYVSQRSRRKPYNNRIMRQLVEEEESSIPFIRHSPVEIYSCDASSAATADNGTTTHIVRSRRSKTRTPSALTTTAPEDNVNGSGGGGGGNSGAVSRLTPTDETSSLGVSDAGAEFGSPASSLDEERLLTPVGDDDNNDEEVEELGSTSTTTDIFDDVEEEEEEIESPQHEALSGNELESHESEKDTKRPKSPKKKVAVQDNEKDVSSETKKVVEKRKSPSSSRTSPNNEAQKRSRRGELTSETTSLRTRSSTRGSPIVVEHQEQKDSEKRSSPLKLTKISQAAESKEDVGVIERTIPDTHKSSSTQKQTFESLDDFASESPAAAKKEASESPKQKLKTPRSSKTPDKEDSQTPPNRTVEVVVEKGAEPNSNQRHDKENLEANHEKKGLPLEEALPITLEEKDQSKEEEGNVVEATDSTDSVQKDSEKPTTISPPLRNKISLSEEEVEKGQQSSPSKKSSTSPSIEESQGKLSSSSPTTSSPETEKKSHNISDSSETSKSTTDIHSSSTNPSDKKPAIDADSSQSTADSDTISPQCDDEMILSTSNDDSTSSPNQGKKSTRWDSPHNLDNKKSVSIPLDTKNHGIEKKVSRWDSPFTTEKSKQASAAADHSPHSHAKKLSRWDSPLLTQRRNRIEEEELTPETSTSTPQTSTPQTSTPPTSTPPTSTPPTSTTSTPQTSTPPTSTPQTSTPPTSTTTTPSKQNTSDESATDELNDSSKTETEVESQSNSSYGALVKTPDVSSPPNVECSTPPAVVATTTTSPTVEKVRINVDVANPLSTQIANILAASGNNQQQQLQQQLAANRNKSQNPTATPSPLKRKHSNTDSQSIGSHSSDAAAAAAAAADGDAVVAHVQSLCPQVKITRKERIIPSAAGAEQPFGISTPSPKKLTAANTTQNTIAAANLYDINQMPIVISNERISSPKKSPRTSNASSSVNSSMSVSSSLWQTEILQAPQTPSSDVTNQSLLEAESHGTSTASSPSSQNDIILSSSAQSPSPSSLSLSSSNEYNRFSLTTSRSLKSSSSPLPHKSPAAGSTGGRKQAGNTVTLPSNITVKQHQHKFAEALASAGDSALEQHQQHQQQQQQPNNNKQNKRRNSQTTPISTSTAVGQAAQSNRRLNSAPALDIRSSPPVKIPKIASEAEQSSPIGGKTWCQSQKAQRQQQQQKKFDTAMENMVVDPPIAETTTVIPASSPSSTKTINTEDVSDVEQLNSTAKITAVPIQPIPGYAETFLLCMLVDNMYKPINNVPHYLNSDLNQLVPVPPEAYEGMLPELAVDQPPAAQPTTDHEMGGTMTGQQSQQHHSKGRTGSLIAAGNNGLGSDGSDGSSPPTEAGLRIVMQQQQQQQQQQQGETTLSSDSVMSLDADPTENVADNAIVLNLENQQIILDAATFEQLLANPDANTQLVTDDGTEFVLTREVLTALKAQHDGQNVELTEAGSSADLLSVALASSEFYGNDVLQIETTLGGVGSAVSGGGIGAAGLQLLASDGSIVFQAPPLPQAHLTPPITAHTSETNAVLNQTPIMSTLEKPSTAAVVGCLGGGGKGVIDSPIGAAVVAAECGDTSGTRRPNLDDSLAVIGVSTQSSAVPTSLELPITVTNPAIAPKVTMAQSVLAAGGGIGGDLLQFQPHRSVATAIAAATSLSHIFDDQMDDIN